MNSDFLSLITIGISVVLLALTRTHLAFVILSLTAGYVLSIFVGPDIFDLLNKWISPTEFPLLETVRITLTLLPAVLIGYRFRKTQRGVGRLVQQLIPALALTMLAAVFIVDILPSGSTDSIKSSSYLAGSIEEFSSVLVIFAVSVALFDVLIKHADEPIRRKRGPGRPKGK